MQMPMMQTAAGIVTKADTTGEGAVWQVGTEYVVAGKTRAMDSDGKTQSKGTIPVSGCFLTYEAAEDGVLSIDQKTLATKRFYVVDSDGKVVVDYQNTNERGTAAKYETLTAQVQAGKTYYIYANGATANILKITFATKTAGTAAPTAVQAQTAKASDGRQVKLSWNAVENGAEEVFYGVDTYVNGEKVDITDGITGTETIMDRLSSGVTYTFKVYVSEKGDNANSMSVTGQNKTLLGEVTVTVDGEKDTADIEAPENVTSELASAVYTHAQGTWTAISSSDARIRGYKIYANGKLVNTVYNYQIPKFATAETVSKQIGRLTPGTENTVEIVAFTDAGVEYKYPLAQITTLGSYDYKAPVFAENAKVTAEVKDNDVVLTWTAATDDTAVGGYRVYVDGTPVVPEGKDFNPVNGDYTTAETTYTVTGLDLTKDHTFTIQAGDTWWKAAQTMGTYDKMAGFNWTVEGISTTLEAKHEEVKEGFVEEDGRLFWYENGVKQGTEGRGKEIYDPASDAWYWLDAEQGGTIAKSKDVYLATGDENEGKWVRYDENGHMVKGWDTTEAGTYYFDLITGEMAKNVVSVDGTDYRFNDITGIALNLEFVTEDGKNFWYEGGIKQGTEGRGKEIYDPESDAWYWLDAVQDGAVATAKDVYLDVDGGKWVRYDEAGHMVKGWDTTAKGIYYFDLITGAMAKGTVTIDGTSFTFDEITGIRQ